MNKKLLSELANPPCEYRGKPFWAWNGKLDQEELRRQIRVMKEMGLGGFFMHSRVGLDTAYLSEDWFDCVDACVDEAKKQKMEAWMYDEDRWPSGAAGGLVTKTPEYRMRSLVMRELKSAADLKWDSSVVAAFAGKVDGGTGKDIRRLPAKKEPKLKKGESILVFTVVVNEFTDWHNGYTYLDTMNHDAVQEFIDVTHEVYRKSCDSEFGKAIPGMFTDEPNYGRVGRAFPEGGIGLPWTGTLSKHFRERYGYDLVDVLPEILLTIDGKEVSQARYHYFDCITWQFVDAFARQIGEWCDKNGVDHTGHVLAEETLSSQTGVVGSAMRFYEYMQAPGMDILTEYNREYDTAKQVSSVARQFGRKWRLTETYGCTGWQFPFAGHKAIGDWQLALGINLRCQHLSWYTMEGQAKRDYPAGIFYQSPWWQQYSKVEDYFARIHAVMTKGKEVRDILVIHPIESMWLLQGRDRDDARVTELNNLMVDVRDCLLAANIDFDYGDEDILARHAAVQSGKLVVGEAAYKVVVVPPQLTIRSSTLKLLEAFQKAGGKVVFSGAAPDYVDALSSEAAQKLARKCVQVASMGEDLVKAVEEGRRVSISSNGQEISPTLHLLREDKNAFYLFVANTGEEMARDGRYAASHGAVKTRTLAFQDVKIEGFAGCSGKPVEVDTETGELVLAAAKKSRAGWTISTSLPMLGTRVFIIPKTKDIKAARSKKLEDLRSRSLNDKAWQVALSEANCIVLDRPRFRIGNDSEQAEEEILRIDFKVRDALGITRRGGAMKQPWAREKKKNPKHTTVELAYTFDVKAIPSGELSLAIEQPKTFQVLLNGKQVNTDAENGWWVDLSLRKIPLDVNMLKLGTNTLELICDYSEDHPGLEIVYLLGNFGAKVKGTSVSMTAAPTKLKLGDWVKQGLPFYSGSAAYCKSLRPELDKGERLIVQVPEYAGVAVRVVANGNEAGIIAWEPNEVDVTDFVEAGKLDLRIEVLGHRRNSHGPHHLAEAYPRWTGPGQYVTGDADWRDDHYLEPCGLMAAPTLIVRG